MCKSVNFEKKIHKYFLENKTEYLEFRENISKFLKENKALYKNKIIDFSCEPFFINSKMEQEFEKIVKTISIIIKKVVDEYLKNPDFRKQFPFSKKMEEMILVDPGYENPAPIGRYDIFYSKNNFQFCELNGDGSSAMNEANKIDLALLQSGILKKLFPNTHFTNYELFESWLNELLTFYKEFGGKEKPNIAIADFENLGTSEEFKVFKKKFEEKGYKTIILDPRKMKYRNGKLFYHDFRIDLIYRRAVNQEVEKRLDEVEDFYKAYKEKAVCVVGPFRSQIMHNKAFFAILRRKENNYLFTEKELEFIQKHIPFTDFLARKEILQLAMKNKDNYVLKPLDLYAGKDVSIGLDFSQEEWNIILQKAFKDGNYLIQEFCKPPQTKLFDKKGNESFFNTTLGFFVYNRKLSGIYQRIGRKNVIASISEAITRSNLSF